MLLVRLYALAGHWCSHCFGAMQQKSTLMSVAKSTAVHAKRAPGRPVAVAGDSAALGVVAVRLCRLVTVVELCTLE
jgi:hypothetical protein